MKEIESRKFACIIAQMLDEKLAGEIEILNISNVSSIADYFVIGSATSSVHVKTLSSFVSENIKNLYDRLPTREESDQRNRWHLIDYGDVVVHIMHNEERQYYALEKFWSHACKVTTDEWMNPST